IIITTAYMSDKLIRSIGAGNKFNTSIVYSFEDTPAGTAGAVKNIEGFIDSTFIVASGDILADVDIKSLLEFHKAKGAKATMALTTVQNPTEFGIVGIDENGRVVRFLEKPKKEDVFSNLVNAGVYVLEPEVLHLIPKNEKYDFSKQVFPKMLELGLEIYGKKIEGLWMDIGRPADMIRANLEMVNRLGKEIEIPGAKVSGIVVLGKNTKIEHGVRIIGPCYIGDNVTVCKGSILDSCVVSKNTFIDKGVLIKNSVIMEGCKIGWQSEIRGSIISERCTIEEDVKINQSIVGDNATIRIHSEISDISISSDTVIMESPIVR
ncbi:MAG: NDP-sugar synthase, partial [Thermoplasmata archaeon]